MTDGDVKRVSVVRKGIQFKRRFKWLFLLGFVLQIAIILRVSSYLWESVAVIGDAGRTHGVSVGLGLGAACGLILGGIGWSAVHAFGLFVDGIKGSKQDRMLVKYFEIATRQAEGRDMRTNRAHSKLDGVSGPGG